jgi:hypothetical protein
MIERSQIEVGSRVKLLKQMGALAPGVVGRVNQIREERWGMPWAFAVYWQTGKVKNRHSLYFNEDDLGNFEMLTGDVVETFQEPPKRCSRDCAEQLALPYTEWVLYRGSDAVDFFETWT